MEKQLRRRLEIGGWTVGDSGDFLGLSDEEIRLIETKLALASGLRQRRGKTRPDAKRVRAAFRIQPVPGRQDGGGRSLGKSGSIVPGVVSAGSQPPGGGPHDGVRDAAAGGVNRGLG